MELSIDCLPNEIVVKIIGNLPVYDRFTCQDVCVRWHNLAHIFMKDIKAFNFGHHWPICDDKDHRPRDSNGLVLSYEKSIKLIDETKLLTHALRSLLSLKCLNVYLRSGESVDVIEKYCPDLECLVFISFEDQAMLKGIDMISKLGHSLRHLKICDESRIIRRNSIGNRLVPMLSKCTKLEIFHISRHHMSAENFDALGPKVREISSQVGGDFTESLSRRSFNRIVDTLLVRQSIINSERMRKICRHFVNLKKLYVEAYTDCDDFDFCLYVSRMTQLEDLEIKFIPKLYNGFICIDEHLTQIFQNCPKLKKISFDNCINSEISDQTFVSMRAHCPQMEHIYFRKCGDMRRVTRSGIESLLSRCTLTHLFLDALLINKCFENQKEWIKALLNSNLKLRYLYIFLYSNTQKWINRLDLN